MQEVFLSLYNRKDELQTTSSLKAYLDKALQNKIYNHYHKELTRRQYEQAAIEHKKTTGNSLSEEYESKELKQQIQERIMQLPPQCRKVFLMSRDEQLPYQEIAKQLNISVNTVDQHIQKALRMLRAWLSATTIVILWIDTW